MAATDAYLRALLDQAAAEAAFLDRLRPATDVQPGAGTTAPSPAVSLMITNQQRAELRARGFSEDTIRSMTPAEAHAQLGLTAR